MLIHKVLNNNAVSCIDEEGNEIILKGKGIAFRKSAGDVIDEKYIEKRFVLADKKANNYFQELISSIPEDIIETSEEIIELIKEKIDKKISDSIYVTLTDHIANLIERINMGIEFDNSILWDVRRVYGSEYQLGLHAVEIIRKNMNIKLASDEANFIALHIVNAELDVDIKDVYEITASIDEVYQFVKDRFHISINEDDLIFSRFMIHLRFFFERLMKQSEEKSTQNQDLLDIMKSKYDEQYQCVEEICQKMSKRFKANIYDSGKLYLLIHIVKLTT